MDCWYHSTVPPYVHDVAVDDLIGSLHTGKLRPQLSECVAASALQDTAVQIYTEKRAYATGTDVMFLAVTEEADPLEFHWQFGDSVTFTTRSRTFIKRFFLPQRYNVTVRVSNALHSISSEIYHVEIQAAVKPNRLLFMPSVLLDTSVRFTCRIDAGTNVSYVWDFGDGTQRVGHSTEQHFFNRTGEFTVEVTVFNLVSSASLKGHLFVVSEPCQPPSVKNMGPSKIQVWRYQPVSIGVTFESQIQCNISSGLLYTWFLYKSTGQQLHIPLIQTNRQSLELPEYLLHYGTYEAVSKVEVVGSIVYSNYSVQIEVMSSLPVSVISGGTNVFINRNNNNVITLDGQKSYDPDYPGYAMSYRWKCRPVNSAESSCFRENLPDSSAVLAFPARALQPDSDMFKFTLTVHSANRSSSSHIFINVRSKPTSFVHISCKECRGNSINWNEPFSVTAMCENCPETVTYSWKLYSVNASSKTVPEGPFCSSVDISLPSKMEEDNLLFQKSEVTTQTSAVRHSDKISSHYPSNSTGSVLLAQIWNRMSSSSDDSPDTSNIYHTTISKASEVTSTSPLPFLLPNSRHLAGEKKSHRSKSRSERSVEHQEEPLAPFDLLSGLDSASESSGASSEDDYLYAVDTEDENTNKNNVTFKHSSIHGDLDYEYFYSGMEEADVGEPVGRPTGLDSLDDAILHSDEREGDNLVDPSSVGRLVVSEKTLLDLNRELIQPALFQSYTFTGASSPSITFKPTSLKPKSLYMLEVSARFDQVPQGKAQLFFNTHSIPEGMACHVQPSTGLEMHTHFSIFCTSGRQDLLYVYSFSVGNSTKKLLYEGRDFQHYFNLPAGDPYNNYEVNIYIEIRNRFGTATKPCPVTVTVQPSFRRTSSSNPDQELFVYGLGNLTTLMLMRNSRDIVNYIYLLTVLLNRLSLDPESSIKLQTDTRAALVSALCQLNVYSKDLLLDILHTLTDLLNASNQVTFDSAILVTKYIHRISSLRETSLPASHILDVNVVKAVVFVLSNVLDTPIPSSRAGIQLTQHVLRGITDSVLMFLHSSKDPQVSVNTTTMNLFAWQHYGSPPTVKTIHTTTFYIPDLLDMHIKQRRNTAEQSFITQLISYKQNPYHWTRTSVQLNGDVSEVKLFNCTSRREIKKRYLSTPVVVEFQKPEEMNKSKDMRFTLARSAVNIHLFSITPELLQKTLQLRVEFSRPTRRTFPIMLLFRMHKKPTLTLYNIQKVYRWKETMVQIFLPPSSLKDAGTAYLMLLNADYNKSPINKYTANAVNYTLSIESIQCLAWDGLREWRPDSCSVLKGFSTIRINCSCSQLTSFTVTHQTIYSNYSVTNITEHASTRSSLTLCILIAVSVAVYAVLLVFCKHADVRTEKSSGSFLLPDNDPSDQFLYAVTIHTGLRSRASMTAKVYIILYGENGASQTRELSSSDHKLFTSNSTNTFILSTPCSLGQVQRVHLWHDASGSSPSWFLSHVLVKDLLQGCSWIFQAQCWLAVDEGDGRVERRLQALERNLTFREMLYLKLTECLEDFHPWLSVYSRPSYSTHTHTQRFSVCFLLLQAYMCANTVLIYLQGEQYSSELGLIGVSPVSVVTGLCALTLLPVGSLVSYLFRISKPNKSRNKPGDQYKVRLPHVYTVEDHHDALLLRGRVSEPNLSRTQNGEKSEQRIQDWKYNRDSTWVTCNKLASDSKLQRTTDSSSCIEIIEETIPESNEKLHDQSFKLSLPSLQSSLPTDSSKSHQSCGSRTNTLQVWCYYTTWALWLCLCLTFMIITAIMGLKFNSTMSLLWIQSVFFSMLFCAFAVHPAMILIIAICTTLRCKEQSYFYQSSTFNDPVTELLKQNKQSRVCFNKHFTSCSHHQPEEITMRARSRNHAPVVQRQIGKDPGDPDHPQPIRNSGDLRPHAPAATACTPQRTKNGGPRQSAHRQRASDRRARGNEQPTPPAGQHPQHEPSMRPPRPQAPETGRPPAGTPPCQRGPNHPQDTTAKGAGQGPRQDVQPCTQGPPGHPYPGGGAESASSGERWGGVTPAHHHVLESRKRERYLRLTHPPTSTQLKYVRCQIKKRTLIQKTIRELMLYMITLSTAGFVAYGKFPNDMFHLNQAVATSCSRYLHRPHNFFHKPEAWWNWAENAILDGLYQQNTSYDGKENNAKTLRGNFFHIGDPVIKKMEYTSSLSQFFQICRFSGLSNRPHLCGKLGCYKGAGIHVHLGKNRSEVSSTLQELRATGWMDRNTEAMIVQFTLYSPAYNLFTTVTMLEEQPPIGGFQPAVFIHSTRLYNSATALDYWLIAAELLFLLLTLLQLYIQICVLAQKAWLYWTNLWNWLEVMSLVISFLSFICAAQHFTLRTDTIEHLQREDFKKFVDVSPVSSWEQFSCSLHGLLVFLLLMKCCFMLRIIEVMTAAVSSMALIFSNLLWLLIAGVILIIAFSWLGNLLFHSNSSVFRTLPTSFYWIISHCFGRERLRYLWGLDHKAQASLVLCVYGALLCTVSVAFKAVVTGAVTSFVRKAAKSRRRKTHLSVSDLLTYTRDMILVLIGKGRQNWMDNHNATNLYLEEFEDLVDELLLRLNVISNSCTLEEQENHYQSYLSFAHDYSSEDAEEEKAMTPAELEPSCACSISSYIHEDCSHRSPLVWKTLQPFGGSRGMAYDRAISTEQRIRRNSTVVPGKKPKDSQTLLCVSVQIECSDTLSSNRDQHFNLACKDNILHKAGSSKIEPAAVLNSPPDNIKSPSSQTMACGQFCINETTQAHSEKQTVNIPGQCF
ncbi:hypothetical protein SRHO_G00278820 [Serrasalmus rhombeus]